MPKHAERLSGHPTNRKNEANQPWLLNVRDNAVISKTHDIASDGGRRMRQTNAGRRARDHGQKLPLPSRSSSTRRRPSMSGSLALAKVTGKA
jgi:hypothetical protein